MKLKALFFAASFGLSGLVSGSEEGSWQQLGKTFLQDLKKRDFDTNAKVLDYIKSKDFINILTEQCQEIIKLIRNSVFVKFNIDSLLYSFISEAEYAKDINQQNVFLKVLEKLLECGAGINYESRHTGNTVLGAALDWINMSVVEEEDEMLFQQKTDFAFKVLTILLRHGAQLNNKKDQEIFNYEGQMKPFLDLIQEYDPKYLDPKYLEAAKKQTVEFAQQYGETYQDIGKQLEQLFGTEALQQFLQPASSSQSPSQAQEEDAEEEKEEQSTTTTSSSQAAPVQQSAGQQSSEPAQGFDEEVNIELQAAKSDQ